MNPKQTIKSRYSLNNFTSGKYYNTITVSGTESNFYTKEDKDKIIIGHKSNSNLDPGYIWVPYLPITTTSIIIDNTKTDRINKLKKLIKES